jgi:hypothetical protein
MSKGEVKNPQTDQRVDNKSGHQGRNPSSSMERDGRKSRDDR